MDSSLPVLCWRVFTKALWNALRVLLYIDPSVSPRDRIVKLRVLLAVVLVIGPPIVLGVAEFYGAQTSGSADHSESTSAWRFVFAYWTVLAAVYLVVVAYWLRVGFSRLNWRMRLQSLLARGVHLRAQMIRAVFKRPIAEAEAMHMAHMNQAMAWSRELDDLAKRDPDIGLVFQRVATFEHPFRPGAVDWAWQQMWVPTMDDRCAKLAAAIHELTIDTPVART